MEYITRVELHDADYLDYEILHTRMTNAGFNRTILANNGGCYHLPPAEYHSGGNNLSTVLNAAKSVANSTGKNSAVFVSQISGWTADGLTLVGN